MRTIYFFGFFLLIFFACNSNKIEADKHFKTAENHIIQKDFAAAEAEFTKAIELDPDRYTPYHGRAEVRLFLGKQAEAKEDFKSAIERLEKNHDLKDPRYKVVYEELQTKYNSL